MKSLILLVWLASIFTRCAAQPFGPTNGSWLIFTNWTESSTAATQALATFRQLVTTQNFAKLGFESANEAMTATLGEPLAVYNVRLEPLQNYQTTNAALSLLTNRSKVLYPVVAHEAVRSSITLASINGTWTERSFGDSNLIQPLTKARNERAAATGLPLSSLFVVQVPALNVYFLGFFSGDRLMLASVFDDPYLQLTSNEPRVAEEVFAALVPFAQKRNRLPG